ncbi:amidohydrolase family protein [Frankia sp. QA3]|uniref:amidohydrolase family protein n=1 Tax=Frankia sp. QA3 TaxID=710111 RepID=UPI000269BECD|nr:amidohydrolase family protein [Frankia sp. QA3]EIV91914.1 putative TIM-barrel fold metal-dependent hydrolase [Frankia sp. QA3]
MDVGDLILVSVDDHVVEPPTMFDAHIPARYRDRAPHVVETADGNQIWTYEGQITPNIGLNAVAGVRPEDYGLDPTRFDQMRPGCHDIDERIRDMNAGGVLASLNFPTFAQFCGQFLTRATADRELGLAVVRAYNDWHIDEWAGAHPGRIIPLAVMPLWDAELMAAEIRRVAAKGCHAVTFSENPAKLGLPSLHSRSWDPFWAACAETNVVVCLHIGSSSQVPVTAEDAPMEVSIALSPMNTQSTLTDLLFSGVLPRFPDLRIALSEGGIGWIPYTLERCDYVYRHHRAWTGTELGDRLPSELFRDQIYSCFIDDPAGLVLRERVGLHTIMWECDYPHGDSTWPNSPEELARSLAGIPDDEVNAITHGNALRAFDFDAFSHRPRERATVAALRAEGADVDLTLRHILREHRGSTPAELAAIAVQAAGRG